MRIARFTQSIGGLLLLLGLSVLPASAESAKDLLGVPGPVNFQDTRFDLAWSANPAAGYFKQEYLSAGQKLESYDQMFIVEASTSATPEGAAAAKIDMLKKRKATDPMVNYAVIRNDATGEIILDFILSDDGGPTLIVEWNAYRYARLNKDGGVALYEISRRAYGDDADAFLRGLKQSRPSAIEALAKFDTPALKPSP